MKLKVIGSNSSGNGYLLKSSTGTLLIECGVHISKIKQAMNFNISNTAAIVSHSHGDHAKSIKDVLNAGMWVYAGKETLEAKGVDGHHRANIMQAGKNYLIEGFQVKPFSVNHDVPCFGFLIKHEEMGLCVFLTDTYYCDYTFPGVNQFILECNHDQEIINSNGTAKFLKDRVIQSHMNINTCKDLLRANDLSQVNNIVLIHLSNTNSDAARFKKEVQELTGKTVTIAEAGLELEYFNKTAI